MSTSSAACPRCGFHRLPGDRSCEGCARLNEQERERARATEQPGDRYVRIVNGKRTYTSTPPKDTIHDPHARKRAIRRQSVS